MITFSSDRNPIINVYEKYLDIPHGIIDNATDGSEYTLYSFLSRPKKLTSFLWHTTDTQASQICGFNVPFDILNQAVFSNKTDGFFGFRATCTVRLTANNTRFQQGRLLMVFFPLTDYDAVKYNNTKGNLVYMTQWPKVEYDASVDTEVSLEIPYVSPETHFNLLTGGNGVGYVSIWVYSPLVDVAGATATTVTVFTEFSNIQLAHPAAPTTELPFRPQAISIPKNNKNRRVKAGSRARNNNLVQLSPSDAEAEEFGVAPISSALSAVSTVASFATSIPILSSVAGPVSWATALAAKVAHAFGYSNPLNNAPVSSVIYRPTMAAINTSGVDNSYNLGLLEDNKVETLPGFAGVDVDEMSMAYILSIPTFFTNYNWTTSQIAGTLIAQINLSAAGFFGGNTTGTVGGAATQQILNQTPVTYLSNMFRYYKGSLIITIKVVKTEFHTGRLMLCFQPYISTPVTYDTSTYLHRDILDLRTSTEFTVTLPFTSLEQYRNVEYNYGFLFVYVLNELQAPPTVSSTVQMLFEVSCADDWEFAVPNAVQLQVYAGAVNNTPPVPVNITNPGLTDFIKVDLDRPFYPQAGDIVDGKLKASAHMPAVAKAIGSSCVLPNTEVTAKYCIGEKIVSLRQLLKRTVPFVVADLTATGTDIQNVGYAWEYDPSFITCAGVAASVPIGTSSGFKFPFVPDYFSFFGSMYALYRGSIRVKRNAPCGLASSANLCGSVSTRPTTGLPAPFFSTYIANNVFIPFGASNFPLPIVPYDNMVYPWFEVQLPYYSPTHVSVLHYAAPGAYSSQDVMPRSIIEQSASMFVLTNTTSNVLALISMSRQIGEDFDFGFFTGTSPLVATVGLSGGVGTYNYLPY